MLVISKVWFAPLDEELEESVISRKVLDLFLKAADESAGLPEEDDFVAIKIHFGEKNNTGYVNPSYLSNLLEGTKDKEAKPYLTDANTLYEGQRDNSVEHLLQAHEHGFNIENTGVPIIIADGLLSKNFSEISIDGEEFDRASISNDILQSDYIISIAHATGSPATGFGATIKNLGMGCASRSGKQLQHADVEPEIDQSECVECGVCVRWCPVDAIEIEEGVGAFIDRETCYGCAECITACEFGAVSNLGDSTTELLQRKMAEYALGVLKKKREKSVFINFLTHITEGCDCLGEPQERVMDDIGVLASTDPVAADKATLDLINEKAGRDLFREVQDINYNHQIEHAEELGLGTSSYEIIEI